MNSANDSAQRTSGGEVKPGVIQGREAFMGNIASRLGRRAPLADAPARLFTGAPEFYKDIKLSTSDKIDLFAKTWMGLTGKVLIVKQEEAKEAIAAYLQQVIEEQQVTGVARWEHEELNALGLDEAMKSRGVRVVPWKETDEYAFPEQPVRPDSNWAKRSALYQSAERCQLGIVWPDYAVANTSTLVLMARGGKGRSVSLVTQVLFAIFHADQLKTRMGEAFADIRAAYPDNVDLSSSINLITGPSRSADIENDLTIGIHGPGKVHAVIITD